MSSSVGHLVASLEREHAIGMGRARSELIDQNNYHVYCTSSNYGTSTMVPVLTVYSVPGNCFVIDPTHRVAAPILS